MTNTDLTKTLDRLEDAKTVTFEAAADYRTKWVAAVANGDADAERHLNDSKMFYEGRASGIEYAIGVIRASM